MTQKYKLLANRRYVFFGPADKVVTVEAAPSWLRPTLSTVVGGGVDGGEGRGDVRKSVFMSHVEWFLVPWCVRALMELEHKTVCVRGRNLEEKVGASPPVYVCGCREAGALHWQPPRSTTAPDPPTP